VDALSCCRSMLSNSMGITYVLWGKNERLLIEHYPNQKLKSKSYLHCHCKIYKLCGLQWSRHNMPPPPASGDLNSHPEFSSWSSPRISVTQSSYSICIPSLKFVGLPILEMWLIIGHGVKQAAWWPLTFDLLISKWGHGSPVLSASFLPIFSFLRPSILDLGSGTEQTDRQTDRKTDNGHQCIMPSFHPLGAGNNNRNYDVVVNTV